MLRCNVTEYLNSNGSTTNSTRQPSRHNFSVLRAILEACWLIARETEMRKRRESVQKLPVII